MRTTMQSLCAGVLALLACALPQTVGAQMVVTYVQTDHLGTPRVVTNEANQVIWRNLPTTEPFGNSPVETDPDGDGNQYTLNLRFPGQYQDKETNLNYNYYRSTYDPSTGRYGESDPIGLRGGINTYTYVGGNPLSYRDPLGLEIEGVFDRSTGRLTVRDVQTGDSVTLPSFSGNGPYANNADYEGVPNSGPIPGGRYLIGNGYDSGHGGNDWWYRLYGPDGKGGYSYTCVQVKNPKTKKMECRSGFNIHTGLASDGCVTVPSDVDQNAANYPQSKKYDQLKKLLDGTKQLNYNGSTFRGWLDVR